MKEYFRTLIPRMKALVTNKNFMVIALCIGGMIGYLQSFVAKVPQVSCSTGYDTDFASILVVIVVGFGFIGGIVATLIFRRTGMLDEQAKVSFTIGVSTSMLILNLILVRDNEVFMCIMLAL